MWVSFVMIPVPQSWLDSSKWSLLFHLNPVYGITSTMRRVLMDLSYGWSWSYYASSLAISVAIFVFGLFYFRRTERRFADIA